MNISIQLYDKEKPIKEAYRFVLQHKDYLGSKNIGGLTEVEFKDGSRLIFDWEFGLWMPFMRWLTGGPGPGLEAILSLSKLIED